MIDNTEKSIIEEQPIETPQNNIVEKNYQEYHSKEKDDFGKIIKDTTDYMFFRLKIAAVAIAVLLLIGFLLER